MRKETLLILLILLLICSMTLLCALLIKPQFELEKISKDLRKQISEGNCEVYTNFYESEFDKLGIKSQRVVLPVSAEESNETIYLEGHTFLVVYNEDGYCKLDQEIIDCVRYLD